MTFFNGMGCMFQADALALITKLQVYLILVGRTQSASLKTSPTSRSREVAHCIRKQVSYKVLKGDLE